MNDLEPYLVEMPTPADGGERWRIEFRIDGLAVTISSAQERYARLVYQQWCDRHPGGFKFCKPCGVAQIVPCPHADTPEQRGWRFVDITAMRIMPMREAL